MKKRSIIPLVAIILPFLVTIPKKDITVTIINKANYNLWKLQVGFIYKHYVNCQYLADNCKNRETIVYNNQQYGFIDTRLWFDYQTYKELRPNESDTHKHRKFIVSDNYEIFKDPFILSLSFVGVSKATIETIPKLEVVDISTNIFDEHVNFKADFNVVDSITIIVKT